MSNLIKSCQMSPLKAANNLHVCKSSALIHVIWFQLVNSGNNRTRSTSVHRTWFSQTALCCKILDIFKTFDLYVFICIFLSQICLQMWQIMAVGIMWFSMCSSVANPIFSGRTPSTLTAYPSPGKVNSFYCCTSQQKGCISQTRLLPVVLLIVFAVSLRFL